MAIHRDRAICLRKYDYSETSQILTLFGRQSGIVRVIAKGAHRRTKAGASKFDGGVDLLDIGDCVYIERDRELSTLTEWKLLSGNLTLRRSLRGVILGQSIAEIITLLLAERESSVGFNGPGDFFRDEQGRLTRRGAAASAPYVYAGIGIVTPDFFADTPASFSFNLLFDRAIARGRLSGHVLQGRWLHVDRPEAIAPAEAAFAAAQPVDA